MYVMAERYYIYRMNLINEKSIYEEYMKGKSGYQPPYTITPAIVNLIAQISEAVGRLTVLSDSTKSLRFRRINRIRTIHGSLAIEGNTLNEEQITAILEGRRVIAPPPRYWRYETPLPPMNTSEGGGLI